MQLDRERIAEIRKYFKPIDRRRVGDYITEMRRQTSFELRDMGIRVATIGRILGVDHSTIVSYRHSKTRKDVVDIVSENRNKWISECLYPMSKNNTSHGVYIQSYVLVSDPTPRKMRTKTRYQRNTELNDEIDELIDSI